MAGTRNSHARPLSITAITTRIPEERAAVLLDHLRQQVRQIADLISEQGYV